MDAERQLECWAFRMTGKIWIRLFVTAEFLYVRCTMCTYIHSMCKIKVFWALLRDTERRKREHGGEVEKGHLSIRKNLNYSQASQVIIEPPNKLIAFTLFFGLKCKNYSCFGTIVLQSPTKSYFFITERFPSNCALLQEAFGRPDYFDFC